MKLKSEYYDFIVDFWRTNFSKIIIDTKNELEKSSWCSQQCPLEKMNFKPVIAGAACVSTVTPSIAYKHNL